MVLQARGHELGEERLSWDQEPFLCDYYDTQPVECIIEKCSVHSFRDYEKLASVVDEDFWYHFKYDAKTEELMLSEHCGALNC